MSGTATILPSSPAAGFRRPQRDVAGSGSRTAGGPAAAQCQVGAASAGRAGRRTVSQAMPAATTAVAAATSISRWEPAASSSSPTASPGAKPATTGFGAPANSWPVRATALLTPDATPACSSSTDPSAVAVNGATVSERPSPNTTMPGNTPVQYELVGSMRASSNVATATTSGPTVI